MYSRKMTIQLGPEQWHELEKGIDSARGRRVKGLQILVVRSQKGEQNQCN